MVWCAVVHIIAIQRLTERGVEVIMYRNRLLHTIYTHHTSGRHVGGVTPVADTMK